MSRARSTITRRRATGPLVVTRRVSGLFSATTQNATIVLDGPPQLNDLIVLCIYHANSSSTSITSTGFTRAISNSLANGTTILYKIAGASEPSSYIVNNSIAGNAAVRIIGFSLQPPGGKAWPGTVATTGDANGSSTTATVTGNNATGGATYDVAAIGMGGGTVTWNHTWTNGFTWDGIDEGRITVAVKDAASSETPSTAETWITSRAFRAVMAAFNAPV